MPAASKAQKAFFALVDKFQRGELAPNEVDDNIRQAAEDNTRADVKKMLATPDKELPDRTVGDTDDSQKRNEMSNMDRYNKKNRRKKKYHEGGDPPPEAVSEPQKNFFGVVNQVQQGDIDPSDVTPNVRQAAKNTSRADVRKKLATDFSGTAGTQSPSSDDKKDEDRSPEDYDIVSEIENDPTKFHEIVSRYNEYGQILKREHKLSELARQLADIAEFAEHALTTETAEDWYDAHTVKRNVREMKKYAKDFNKYAKEADLQHERLVAYYEDMGRVLERYFEIASLDEEGGPTVRVKKSGLKGPHFESFRKRLSDRAVQLAEQKLSESDRKRFRALPESKRQQAAWKII